jgi:hypothetical protein
MEVKEYFKKEKEVARKIEDNTRKFNDIAYMLKDISDKLESISCSNWKDILDNLKKYGIDCSILVVLADERKELLEQRSYLENLKNE